MSVITGGIFGRVRNKTADVIFSQARGRRGTVNTIRQYVIPANPNTLAQQSQRSFFKSALEAIRQVGIENIRAPFNRLVGQLPAFQSFMSLALTQIANELPIAWPSVRLGPLPAPVITALNFNDSDDASATFSDLSYLPTGTYTLNAAMLVYNPSTDEYIGGAFDSLSVDNTSSGIEMNFNFPGVTLVANTTRAVIVASIESADGITRGTTASMAGALFAE